MNRRDVLKGFGLIPIVVLPDWASGWNQNIFDENHLSDNLFFEALVEIIIPETDSPGAKSLGVHKYVSSILNDCYPDNLKVISQNMIKFLNDKAFTVSGKNFTESDKKVRFELFAALEKGESVEAKSFFQLMKKLTIQGFTSSEYFLTTYRSYQMAPGFFHGCVPV
jgi:hypothetical protein